MQGLGKGSPWRLWTCDSRYSFWESVTLDCVHVTPSAGFGREGHHVDWTYVNRCKLWAGGTPWILSKCDPRHRVWAFPHSSKASPIAQSVKNLPAMQETWVQVLGQEDFLEKGMPTHSSILAWRIPWREERRRLQSMGSQELDTI